MFCCRPEQEITGRKDTTLRALSSSTQSLMLSAKKQSLAIASKVSMLESKSVQ